MLTQEMKEILSASKEIGWVLEPQAKRLLASAGLEVPRFSSTAQIGGAIQFAEEIGYPVVAKVVSPKVKHKSDRKGVVVGVENERKLRETFQRFSKIEGFCGVLIEEMVSGLELFVGAKNDDQFGPVILFGIGGVWVEIYRDVILRMAPLTQRDIDSMTKCLRARPLLDGYRGSNSVNFRELNKLLMTFSDLVMDLESYMESIDLNPVMGSPTKCVVADARIILRD